MIEATEYVVTMSQLMEFFLNSFQKNSQAELNLDYSLIEMHNENSNMGMEQQSETVVMECRKIGITLLRYLENLGCFKNDALGYSYATTIGKDTFMFWRPENNDVDK